MNWLASPAIPFMIMSYMMFTLPLRVGANLFLKSATFHITTSYVDWRNAVPDVLHDHAALTAPAW
jgi:hypothetical protein